MLEKYRAHAEQLIYARLEELAMSIDRHFSSTIAYGPFRGMKFSEFSTWSRLDRGGMILGLYEKEILDALTKKPDRHKTFIDIGAADGYYAVGVLVGNLFEKTYCFELNNASQSVILDTANNNGVENRIVINGGAEPGFWKNLPNDICKNSVILVDIEGAEFDLLTDEFFEAFRGAVIIVELHDWFFTTPNLALDMKTRASKNFQITEIKTGARDMSVFPELARLNDNDRWLLCSERRGRLMTWLRFDPK